ncbi:hypothetical protein [Altererythrobacter sp.]|uniref:hypothetical protein n=1 Tax=Altererythrobacter sp. TaxID=1872480 RepID=UPI001B149C03|nr:hypothetical protein [Altererythrobacter sp.]MBO6608743.1 hypothetical protein [Altererythrobacter sp.]MBO6642998.1 hypothetical protein [Altererythrobacter sp.]MBO6709741.1 hypothetical protein [Altererythrobacter sp.]MBO6943951.1 hypothetical protein [Altererythrobacter sp.]
MSFKLKTGVALAAAFSASACATVEDAEWVGYQDPGFGEANRATYAAMIVNPDPEYDTPIPATSAEKAAQAIERYRNDQVKKPERISTTEEVSGGNN